MNYWDSGKIIVRAPTEQDIEQIVDAADSLDYDSKAEWLADELHPPRSAQTCRAHWECIAKEGQQGDNCQMVIVDRLETLCGFINVFQASPRHGSFSYGLSLLPPYRRKGFAQDAVRLLLDYYFNHLRYHRCGIHIYAFNARSLHFHKRFGFELCGDMHEACYFNGEHHDIALLEMLSGAFNARYGKRISMNDRESDMDLPNSR